MDAGWITVVRNQGKVTRMMISILLMGMYWVCIEQKLKQVLRVNWTEVEGKDLDWDGWKTCRNPQEMKVKRWWQKAVDREEWASIIKQTKVLRGPQSQGVSELSEHIILLHCAFHHVIILWKDSLLMTGKPRDRFYHLAKIFQVPSLVAENGDYGFLSHFQMAMQWKTHPDFQLSSETGC